MADCRFLVCRHNRFVFCRHNRFLFCKLNRFLFGRHSRFVFCTHNRFLCSKTMDGVDIYKKLLKMYQGVEYEQDKTVNATIRFEQLRFHKKAETHLRYF